LAGITGLLPTLPPSHASVAGRPVIGLLEDNVHPLAPRTEALTIVVPPEATLDGVAAKSEMTGFIPLAAAA
jgi:hypothetical protein